MITKPTNPISGGLLLKDTPYNLYIAPHALLRPYISNYTVSFPERNMVSSTLTLIPDASGTLSFAFDGSRIISEYWGATTKTVDLGGEVNSYSMLLLVEFLPGGLYQLTGIPQTELADERLLLQSIDKALAVEICDVLEQAGSIEELAAMLNTVFLSYMLHKEKQSMISQAAVQMIKNSYGQLTVKELSASLHYSERHINRNLNECIGMSVKTFSRLVRINNAVRRIQRPQTSLLRVALESGFYDEAHFINEFKTICGVSPDYYFKNMSDFYNETLKI